MYTAFLTLRLYELQLQFLKLPAYGFRLEFLDSDSFWVLDSFPSLFENPVHTVLAYKTERFLKIFIFKFALLITLPLVSLVL